MSEIFQDLALLVSEQGEHIDNIQTNIESAANNTARGAREPAREPLPWRARGRMCMFGVLLIIVIVALILVLKFALKMI